MSAMSDDAVVVSGIAGKFPASNHVQQFMDNVFNEKDMVSASNDGAGCATIPGRDKFDAPFFRVAYKQAKVLDPACRLLLEQAYCAIYDAGVNPGTLRGGKVGVFIGASYDNSYKMYDAQKKNIYIITGNGTKAMYANRISYWLDSKGPSCNVDAGECSSLLALHAACSSVRRGECSAAIVGGLSLRVHTALTTGMERAGLCSRDATATTRAEAVNVIFLQKYKDANRVYAEICHSDVRYIATGAALLSDVRDDAADVRDEADVRSAADVHTFLEQFYVSAGVPRRDVRYIETQSHVETNSEELRTIHELFGEQIQTGCVKRLMGNAHAASGLCALTRICVAYQKGRLYSPLQCVHPDDAAGRGTGGAGDTGLAAINSFSSGGMHAHLLLKCYQNKQCSEEWRLPRLVVASGRDGACVLGVLDALLAEPLDVERVALLHRIHRADINGHVARGYTILEADGSAGASNTCLARDVQLYPGARRPLWFVYSGMGSQWPAMGRALLHMPIFAAAVERCRAVLEPRGIDILHILTTTDRRVFDNILHSFVGIATVQIGLTDIMYTMGIVPDYIIGHSVGELGCAYADGCMTAEEMVLAAYSRGLVSVQTAFIRGAMAAVSLSSADARRACDGGGVEVACHNGAESCTVSGPQRAVHALVARLHARGVFAKEVPVSNIAYHSKYIAHAGPALLEELKDIIPNPKLRSKKWICTSLPPQQWDEPRAKYCSAEYHTNNLLNPVYFHEASQLIPEDAVVVELAPHGLLQAILRRARPDALHVPLTKRWHSNPIKHLLEAVGKIYEAGFNPLVEVLYPKIHFPVSCGTLGLSHVVQWAHAETWPSPLVERRERVATSVRELLVSVHDEQFAFMQHYIRNGYNVLPEAAMLYFAWDTLAMFRDTTTSDLSVSFQNVIFHNELKLSTETILKLSIAINIGDGGFEISCCDTVVASGVVRAISGSANNKPDDNNHITHADSAADNNNVVLNTHDVYKILYYRGYQFKSEFQSIISMDMDNMCGTVRHSNNWITMIDALIQVESLKVSNCAVCLPACITRLDIDTRLHAAAASDLWRVDANTRVVTTRCGGIELSNIIFANVPLGEPLDEQITELTFVPYDSERVYDDVSTCVGIMLQMVADNVNDTVMRVADNVNDTVMRVVTANVTCDALLGGLDTAMDALGQIGFKFKVTDVHQDLHSTERIHLVIGEGLLDNNEVLSSVASIVNEHTFILTLESNAQPNVLLPYQTVCKLLIKKQCMLLLRTVTPTQPTGCAYIHVDDAQTFAWVAQVHEELRKHDRVVLVHERNPLSGLLGFVKKLKDEIRKSISLLIVEDCDAPAFDPKHEYYQQQLQKGLTVNVLKQGKWGGYWLVALVAHTSHDAMLTLRTRGDTLQWSDAPLQHSAALVRVSYAGLSHRDCQRASLADEPDALGMDYSGINEREERVMGVARGGAARSCVCADDELTWPVPSHWSMEDAATVPMPYLYAYYCLSVRCEVRAGQTVLVGGGAGAVGQAAIALCVAVGCTVYTTVGDHHKKQLLLNMFPQLHPNNILYSRDPAFYCSLLSTGRKCDIVISPFTGQYRKAAMKCVANSGILFNINHSDCDNSDHFGMHFLTCEKSVINVDLSGLFRPQNAHCRKLLRLRIAEGIAMGWVRPLTRAVYAPTHAPRALRLLRLARHRGRVLLLIGGDAAFSIARTLTHRYNGDGVCIVLSDTKELGIEVADYLARRGAQHVVVNLPTDHVSGYATWKQRCWQKLGVESTFVNCKLQTDEQCMEVLRAGSRFGAVRGIYVVLDGRSETDTVVRDGRSDSDTVVRDGRSDSDKFPRTFRQTAAVLAHVNHLSQQYCKELSEFVVITRDGADSGGRRHAAAACLCQRRARSNLPALALTAHAVDEFPDGDETRPAARRLSLRSVFKAMEVGVRQQCSVVHVQRGVRGGSAGVGAGQWEEEVCGHVERDEVAANEPVVGMRTAAAGPPPLQDCESIATDECVMLIPGVEGHRRVYRGLCDSVRARCIALQLCVHAHDTVADIAAHLRASMKKCNIIPKTKFYIVGFSFGVMVALELAAILEHEGLVGVVYCVAGSPHATRRRLATYMAAQPRACTHHAVLTHVQRAVAPATPPHCPAPPPCRAWDRSVALHVQQLKGCGYSMQYLTAIIHATFNRLTLALNYDTDIKLKSRLIVITKSGVAPDAADDRLSEQPITYETVDAPPLHACRLPYIIHRYMV